MSPTRTLTIGSPFSGALVLIVALLALFGGSYMAPATGATNKWTSAATSPVRGGGVQLLGFPWPGGTSFAEHLCAQDFDDYEEAVISDETLQAAGAGILDGESVASSPRSPDPARR